LISQDVRTVDRACDWLISNLITVKLTYDKVIVITAVCDELGKTVAEAWEQV